MTSTDPLRLLSFPEEGQSAYLVPLQAQLRDFSSLVSSPPSTLRLPIGHMPDGIVDQILVTLDHGQERTYVTPEGRGRVDLTLIQRIQGRRVAVTETLRIETWGGLTFSMAPAQPAAYSEPLFLEVTPYAGAATSWWTDIDQVAVTVFVQTRR